MVIWGAFWGAVLGLLWPGGEWAWQTLLGAGLGALAGRSLRAVVHREIQAPREPAPVEISPAAQVAMPQPVEPAAPLPTPAPQVVPPDAVTVLYYKARGWLFGGNTVVRMGVLVLFVGLAFLAKYAADNALLPPELRLAAVGAAAIALFTFGFRLRSSAPDKLAYSLSLQGAGVAVLYLTVFAAFRLYQFIPAGAAFVALGLAIAAMAWARAWRALNLLGFFATFGVATLWGVLRYQPEQFASTEPFLVAFFLVYVAASYRVAAQGADSVNPPTALHGASVKRLRIESTNGADLTSAGLQASPDFEPVQLVFVATGSGPFELAAGRAQTAAAALPLSTLASALAGRKIEDLPQAQVGGAVQAPRPEPEPLSALLPDGVSTRTLVLWGVLLLGGLLLAGVAWSLVRQLRARQ